MANDYVSKEEERSDKEFDDCFEGFSDSPAQELTNRQESETQSTSNSFLLRLAPELRNRIYGYVVTYEDPIDLQTTHDFKGTKRAVVKVTRQPALTRTCSTTRSESLAMFYALNTFHGSLLREDDFRWATDLTWMWLHAIGESRTMLHNFTATMDTLECPSCRKDDEVLERRRLYSIARMDRRLISMGLKMSRPAYHPLLYDPRDWHGGGRVTIEIVPADDAIWDGDLLSREMLHFDRLLL